MGWTRWGLGGALLCAAPAALACGGLFCSAGPAAAPVDQRAERILFEVYGERICATVQILYEGTPTQLAWVVPVPSTPEVSEGSPLLLERLEEASRPRFLLPDDCGASSAADTAGGCGCGEGDAFFFDPQAAAARLPVDVYGRQSTESYDTVTLEAESAADVVRWLQLNQYQVGSNMAPAMQPYADAGSRFLAVQLRAGADADGVRPLRFCYDAAYPMVPLRLTAVAARPQMAVQVLVASDMLFTAMEPTATRPDAEALVFDAAGRVNYHAWVAAATAEAEGRFIVDEWSGKNPIPDGDVEDCPGCRFERELPLLSRFYLRLDPEQMTWDPAFVPTEEAPNEGVVDLRGHPPVTLCGEPIAEARPSPCAYVWCGDGDCRVEGERAGCVCDSDQVATALTDLEGQRQITCVPPSNAVGVQVSGCDGVDCGLGECVSRGGFPACACEPGAMAVTEGGQVRCISAEGSTAYDPVAAARQRLRLARVQRPRLGLGVLALLGVLLATGYRRRR